MTSYPTPTFSALTMSPSGGPVSGADVSASTVTPPGSGSPVTLATLASQVYAPNVASGGEFDWYANGSVIARLQNNLTAGTFFQVPQITNGNFASNALGEGAWLKAFMGFSDNFSGIQTGGNNALAQIEAASDTVTTGSGLTGLNVIMNSGGTGMVGNRIAGQFTVNFSGNGSSSGSYLNNYASAIWGYLNVTGSTTTVSGQTTVNVQAGVLSATIAAGCTGYNLLNGLEIDVGAYETSGAGWMEGLKVLSVSQSASGGGRVGTQDYAIGIQGVVTDGSTGWNVGLLFGSPYAGSHTPIISTGTLISSVLGEITGFTVANAINFSNLTITGKAWQSPGFSVDGSGNTTIGSTSANYITLSGAATGSTPTFNISGASDSNVGINIQAKGTGNITLYSTANFQSSALFQYGAQFNAALVLNASGPQISAGTGAPGSGTPGYSVASSIRLRTDGATGSRLYVSTGSGWNAVAGV